MIRDSRVAGILRSKGYRCIYLGGGCLATSNFKHSDHSFDYYMIGNNFNSLLIRSSVLLPVYNINRPYLSRKLAISQFDKLAEIPYMAGPKFVFVHIYSPHAPFVFSSDGGTVAAKDSRNWRNKSFYLNQYIFITRKVEDLVDRILSRSKKEPIIIIQSDHGVRSHFGLDLGDYHQIFNACYLPGGSSKILTESISPADTFRVIFNYYFNTNYERT